MPTPNSRAPPSGSSQRGGRNASHIRTARTAQPVAVARRPASRRLGLPGGLEQPQVGQPQQGPVQAPGLAVELLAQLMAIPPGGRLFRQGEDDRGGGLRGQACEGNHAIILYS